MIIFTISLTISLLYLLLMVWKYKKIIREQANSPERQLYRQYYRHL